jgi:hypothetical protein
MINNNPSSGDGLDPTGRPDSGSSAGGSSGTPSTPNAGAGTPQSGSSSPQLSSSTQKKMQNAGMNPSGGSSGSGEVSREEFDRLVDQNQQIIDLLEDLVGQIKSQNNRR